MIGTHQLSKAYDGRRVLHDVSVQFPRGQVTSLIGPNGAGKSTLLHLLARLTAPDTGSITLDGRPVADFRPREYAMKVATLRQSPDITLRLTVEELVAFGRFPYSRGVLTAQDRRIISESLAFMAIDGLRTRYIDELSGGQRQLAMLAMTIAQQTPVLLLDEPLNNLDMKHAVTMMQAVRRLCDDAHRTVIMVVHDINFAANYSDHIVAMKDGAIRFSGPAQSTLTAPRLNALFGLEFEILGNQHSFICNYYHRTKGEPS